MRHVRKIGSRLLLGCVAAALWAGGSESTRVAGADEDDVRVTATVDRDEMDPNDTLFLSVTSTSSSDRKARIPSAEELADGPLKQFDVLKEWEESGARSQMTSDPSGGMKFDTVHTRSRNFALQPRGAGKLSIGSIDVQVGGKIYATKSISIRVAPGASPQARGPRGGARPGRPQPQVQPQPQLEEDDTEEDLFALLLRRQGLPVPPGFGGGPAARGALPPGGFRTQPMNPQDAFFIQVEVDKTEAYVGEQVTASWYLYTRGQIRDLDTLKYPSLKGFWKEDIEISTHLNFSQEVVNGIPYKKALLASFALFPIKEGNAIVDPYTAKCSVVAFEDPFGAFSGKSYAYTKSSNPVKITVKPVPAEGRPADFSGAVGQFQVSARVEDPKVIENQPFSLKIRFEGRGNAKLIEAPPFQPPEGLELYDTQKDSKFFKTGTSFKDFSLLLIPRRAGSFTLPPVTVSIFDPELKKFVQRATEPVAVVAAPGAPLPGGSKPLAVSEGRPNDGKPTPPAPDVEFRSASVASPLAPVVCLAGLLGATSIAIFARARSRLGWGRKRQRLAVRIRARFAKIESTRSANSPRDVAREAINAFYWALGEASGQGGANAEIEKLLERAPPSVRRELGSEAAKAMEKLQALAFAPEASWGSLKEPAALKELLKATEALLVRAAALAESFERSV